MSDADASTPDCSAKLGGPDIHRSLRIASLFVILLSSAIGSFFPLIAKRSLRLPGSVYEFAKYFGSGVIIATAFIHLLSPAFEELGSECLAEIWQIYPWPAAIALSSVFFIFFVELFAFRWGTARIKKLNAEAKEGKGEGEEGGFRYDTHGHALEGGSHAAHGPEGIAVPMTPRSKDGKHHEGHDHGHGHEGHSHQAHSHSHADHSHQPLGGEGKPLAVSASASSSSSSLGQGHGHGMMVSPLSTHPLGQYVSVLILESGIIFHSFIIGLTLAVSQDFIPLFIVIVFHQLFEGLGLGTRLSQLLPARHCHHLTDVEKAQEELSTAAQPSQSQPETTGMSSKKMRAFPYLGAAAFALTTPLGIAIGLGLQSTYDPGSNTANIVSGVLDAFSSGILMYTGLVELLAHEFLFSPQMMERPLWGSKGVVLAGAEVLLGAGLMSLLGRWA